MTSMNYFTISGKMPSCNTEKQEGHYINQIALYGKQKYHMKNKCGLLLIIKHCKDLIISEISIKEVVMRIPCQPFHHMIDKWKGKVILSSNSVEFTISNTSLPTCSSPGGNQFVLFILYHRKTTLLRHYLNSANLCVVYRVDNICIQKLQYHLCLPFLYWDLAPLPSILGQKFSHKNLMHAK